MVRFLTWFFAAAFLGISTLGYANEAPDYHEKDADLDAVNKKINFFGYVDGSYNYLVRSPYLTSGAINRLNDLAEQGARLQQVYLSAEIDQPGFGGFMDVVIGSDANTLAPLGWNSGVFQLHHVGLMVPEAYAQYLYRDFRFQVGLIMSVAGLESYIYTEDTNFSRSILDAYAVPGNHVGMRATQVLSKDWSAFVGVGNGWGTVHQAGQLSALEFGVMGVAEKLFSFTIDAFITPVYIYEPLTVGPQGTRYLLDTYGTYQLTESLMLAGNIDVATQSKALLPTGQIGSASWAAVAGYMNYQWAERWRTSVRGEVFNDHEGSRTGVRQNWKELTLTLGYVPIKNLSLMLETRHDFSNVNAFVNRDRINSNNNQQSYALNMLYQFV